MQENELNECDLVFYQEIEIIGHDTKVARTKDNWFSFNQLMHQGLAPKSDLTGQMRLFYMDQLTPAK